MSTREIFLPNFIRGKQPNSCLLKFIVRDTFKVVIILIYINNMLPHSCITINSKAYK